MIIYNHSHSTEEQNMPQTLNIAVCEDEAAETLLLCDILSHSDIQNTYTVFTDADSFLASYEHGKYDLLLMDIYMKDSMTGIEAVSIIRETNADIPVAFITNKHGACPGKLQAVCHRLYRKAGFCS